ncbi:HigA family addiction module antitoxin [Ghiorsea bivora]|uniref:HigA family addiction module antitoxin n=1 Tax=Ghiorsea bivora TaxID=1485545 RepID=UPI00056E2857|nr:HigA family addiction module antitoxin [Ghiorsea bivora]
MHMFNPVHPGEILRHDILEPMGVSIVDAAKSLDISRKTLSKICNGNGAITPEMAVRLELAFGKPSAQHWLKLQTAYDLNLVNQKRQELQRHIHPLAA